MFNPRKPKYTFFKVREASELLPYIMQCLDGISRSKAKAILAGGGVRVDKKNVSQHDFMLQPGMMVEISKQKPRTQFQSKFLKIVYEDAQSLLSRKTLAFCRWLPRRDNFASRRFSMIISESRDKSARLTWCID